MKIGQLSQSLRPAVHQAHHELILYLESLRFTPLTTETLGRPRTIKELNEILGKFMDLVAAESGYGLQEVKKSLSTSALSNLNPIVVQAALRVRAQVEGLSVPEPLAGVPHDQSDWDPSSVPSRPVHSFPTPSDALRKIQQSFGMPDLNGRVRK